MWAICDIAMHLIFSKSISYDTREFPLEARIPSMYFQAQPDDFRNTRIYLPADLYHPQNMNANRKHQLVGVFFF